jgi:hypothetical protein
MTSDDMFSCGSAALQAREFLLFWQAFGLCDFSRRAKTSYSFGLREAPWSAVAAATALECGRGSDRSAMQ